MIRTIVVSAAVIALLLLIFLAMRVPMAPMLWAPPDGAVRSSSAPTTFTWRYGGQLLRRPVFWRKANYFVVCVQEFTQLDDMKCEYPSSPGGAFPYAAPVGDFPSRSGAPGSSWEELIRFFDHTVDQLPPELRDRQLMWTVAACASTAANSCNMAAPPFKLLVTNLNLTAIQVDEARNGNDVSIGSDFQNSGAADPGPFKAQVRLVEIHLNANQRPDKDLTKFNRNTDHVFTKKGELILIKDFTGAPSDHKGVVVAGGYQHTIEQSFTGLAPGATASVGGTVTIAAIANHTVTDNFGLALVLVVDSANQIIESSEDDNFADDRGIYPREGSP